MIILEALLTTFETKWIFVAALVVVKIVSNFKMDHEIANEHFKQVKFVLICIIFVANVYVADLKIFSSQF